MKKWWLLAFLVLLAGGLISACGSAGSESGSTSFEVDMTEFTFDPKEFVVPAGKEISLTLVNKGAIKHEFVIMNLGVEITVPFGEDDQPNIYWEHEAEPGATVDVTFTAPSQPGEYQVICGIPGHAEAGMTAKLVVVSP